MNLTNPFSTPTVPGNAGPAAPGQPVVYDPTTGLYVNQQTGAVSTDPAGQHPVQNPSLATQAARNISISNGLLSKLSTFGQQYNQAFGGQTDLAARLKAQSLGLGPSAARTQLETGLGNIRSAENSEAAGATGADAALARSNAMQNTARAGAATNQAQGVARVNEELGSEAAEGALLGQQAGEANQGYATNLTGGLSASGQAQGAEGATEQANQQATEQQNQLEFNLLNGAGTAAAKAAVSDEREKKDLSPLDDKAMAEFTSKLADFGKTFRYKNPGKEGESPGPRVGGTAQDMKKAGAVGKSIVIDGKPMKMDLGNAVGAALAAIGYLSKKMKETHGGA